MKEQVAASVQAEVLLPAGCNRMQQFAHVLLPVGATIVVVHLHALLPVFRQARLQEVVAVRVRATVIPHLQEARVHILLLQEVAAVVVAVDRSVAEVAVAAVQVAVAAVVQVDADNERDNIIIV